jgi:hypothetical protein
MSTWAAALAAVAAAGPRSRRDWARAPSYSKVSCRGRRAGSAAPSAVACSAITPEQPRAGLARDFGGRAVRPRLGGGVSEGTAAESRLLHRVTERM